MYTLYKKLLNSSIGKWFQVNEFRYYTLPLIIWVIIMLILSSIPGSGIPSSPVIPVDKIAHFTEYLVFAALLGRYIYFKKNRALIATLLIVFIVSIVYSALDELHQLYIPYRDCSYEDLIADILGVLFGLLAFRFIAIKDFLSVTEREKN